MDFCRTYAQRARADFAEPLALPGPTGERNQIALQGRGVFACISPWNFPLAIFCGQVTAALAAGNAVIAKPAEQTPLIAAAAVRLLHEAGIPGEAVRRYLEELGLPQHDVQYDLPRIRRLAIEAIEAMTDEELAQRAGVPVEVVPVLRGARDLNEAREYAETILTPPTPAKGNSPETLERFRELLERSNGSVDARALVRELKAVGGDLRSLRVALTGRERGPELWAVIAALPREETLRRIDAAL